MTSTNSLGCCMARSFAGSTSPDGSGSACGRSSKKTEKLAKVPQRGNGPEGRRSKRDEEQRHGEAGTVAAGEIVQEASHERAEGGAEGVRRVDRAVDGRDP